MNKYWLVLIVIVLLVGVGLLVFLWPRPDCAFTGWKRTIGVELDVESKDVNAVKGKLGITDEQARDYDQLLKDYALKYDTACRDFNAKRISQAEYTCRRRNMDQTLDEIRRFAQAVQEAKTITDVSAQKEEVQKSLADFRAAAKAEYRMNCVSALDVNPKNITFTGARMIERSIQITNRGNNPLTYSVTGLPEAFDPKPPGGILPTGGPSVSVSLLRLPLPLSSPAGQPIRFHVRTNLNDDEEVVVVVDEENANLYRRLGEEVKRRSQSKHNLPDLGDALEVVSEAFSTESSKHNLALTNYVAADVLLEAGNPAAARQAMDIAIANDPSLAQRPSTLLVKGIIAAQQGNSDQALDFFANAKNVAPAAETGSKSASDLFSAAVLLSQGKKESAVKHLSHQEVFDAVEKNPGLLDFAGHKLGTKTGSIKFVFGAVMAGHPEEVCPTCA